MEGSSVTRFKEILKVFTNYGLGYLLGKKEEKEKKKIALQAAFHFPAGAVRHYRRAGIFCSRAVLWENEL